MGCAHPDSELATRRGQERFGRGSSLLVVLMVVAMLAVSCSDDDSAGESESSPEPTATAGDATTPTTPEASTPTTAPTAEPEASGTRSTVRSVTLEGTTELGSFGGLDYVTDEGFIEGLVDAEEAVAGLGDLTLDDEGFYPYSAQFQIVRPADGADTVLVEAPNRGNGLLRGLLGDDFLFGGGRAYATVAWQSELNPDVPATAQGIGEVIVRDFARLLRDGAADGTTSPLGSYSHRIHAGWSQGAWFATTLVAEGFNVDPVDGSGVFDGIIAVSGAGNVLAINGYTDAGEPQQPYIRPDAAPLEIDEVLTRPGSDPLFVDIANYTDFYRLRAGLTAGGSADGYWRFDWPSAHAPGSIAPAAIVFGSFGCNDGVEVPTNPIDFRPYLRAVLVGLETELGAPVPESQRSASGLGLPASAEFVLTDVQPEGTGELNALPGTTTPVPEVDDDLQPVGGVRFAAAVTPLGRPSPVGLPPVTTASISEVCGNFGGWMPSEAPAVIARWPSVDAYLADVDPAMADLIAAGYLLPQDQEAVRSAAADAYVAATTS